MLATLENNLGAYSDAIRDATDLDGSAAATVAQRATAAAIAGLAYKNQKKEEEAIRLLKRSIELTPGEPAYLALAEIYEMSEKTAEAVKLLEKGTAALPASQKIALVFGRTLVDAGDHQRAAAVLSGITQQASADVESWHWLAQAETSLGNFKKATEALEELGRRQPDYPLIDVMIAQSLLKWDPPDYEQALRFLDRAAKTAPTDPDVYYMRGKIYYSLGRYAEAIKPLQRAIELGPTASASYYQLGQALQKLGREAEAKEQFDKVRYLKSASAAP
jgi:tetratricopeptide (TPR) repeat protein